MRIGREGPTDRFAEGGLATGFFFACDELESLFRTARLSHFGISSNSSGEDEFLPDGGLGGFGVMIGVDLAGKIGEIERTAFERSFFVCDTRELGCGLGAFLPGEVNPSDVFFELRPLGGKGSKVSEGDARGVAGGNLSNLATMKLESGAAEQGESAESPLARNERVALATRSDNDRMKETVFRD
jgi:hypothetical protein